MSSITQLIDRGLVLRQEIQSRQKELKSIEDRLKTLGLQRPQEDLKDADREGRRWLARGSDLVIPVVFTADKLIQSFQDDSPTATQIIGALPPNRSILEFFARTVKYETLYKDGKQFRRRADELLGPAAPAFVTACVARDKHGIPKSDAKVCWDDSEPVTSALLNS